MDTNSLPVIVAVDGSPDSERALHWAVEEARIRATPLRVVHVWPYVTATRADSESGTGDPVLDAVRAKMSALPELPETEFRSLSGRTDSVLPRLGRDARLLVVGSRGRGGFASLLLGSTGMACAAHSACPVVVVPRPDRDGTRAGAEEGAGADTGEDAGAGAGTEPARSEVARLTLGVDPIAADEEGENCAIGFAFAEAARRRAVLRVIAAYAWPILVPSAFEYPVTYETTRLEYEEGLATTTEEALAPYRARHPEVVAEVHMRAADAAGQLVEASRDSDLVIVSRHRRRLPIGRRLGSVAHAVLLHAVCPIAVVPEVPDGAADEDNGGGPGQ